MAVYYKTATSVIADGGNLGTVVDLGDSVLVGVIIDSLWDAGDELGFKVCDTEGGTYVPLYDKDASLVSLGVTASRAYSLDPQIFGQWRYIKAWSQNGSGTNAAQAGGSTVTFTMK